MASLRFIQFISFKIMRRGAATVQIMLFIVGESEWVVGLTMFGGGRALISHV
jgi:hypothetical protein